MYALANLLHHSACARNLGHGGSPQHTPCSQGYIFSPIPQVSRLYLAVCLDVVVVPPPNNHRRRFPARRSRSAKRSYGRRATRVSVRQLRRRRLWRGQQREDTGRGERFHSRQRSATRTRFRGPSVERTDGRTNEERRPPRQTKPNRAVRRAFEKNVEDEEAE